MQFFYNFEDDGQFGCVIELNTNKSLGNMLVLLNLQKDPKTIDVHDFYAKL